MEDTLSSDEHWFMIFLLFLPIWIFSTMLSTMIFGHLEWSIQQQYYTTLSVAIPTIVLVVVVSSPGIVPHTVPDFFRRVFDLITYTVLIAILGLFVHAMLLYTVWKPLVSLIEYGTTIPAVVSAIVLGLGGLSLSGILFAVKKTGPAVDWSLILRMVASLFILAVVTVWFLNTLQSLIQGIIWGVSPFGIGPDIQEFIATVVTIGLVAALAYHIYHVELGDLSSVEHGGATSVSPDEFPTLHSITTTVAAQLDIPMPTLVITEQTEPEAITVGYRPTNIHLVLSQGTLDALSDDAIEAVIAHELAHVANMDAMVMTVASLPALLADGLWYQYTETVKERSSSEDSYMMVMASTYPYLIFTLITAYLSRPAVAVLSRARESAADRTAATVSGSPTKLASALRTLDDRIAEIPAEDLREASNLSSLSILSLHSIEADPDQNVDPVMEKFKASIAPRWWWRAGWLLFATHPPTDRRIDALTALSEEHQAE